MQIARAGLALALVFVAAAGGAGRRETIDCISASSTRTMPPLSPRTVARNDSGTGASRSIIGEPTPMKSKAEAGEDMGFAI